MVDVNVDGVADIKKVQDRLVRLAEKIATTTSGLGQKISVAVLQLHRYATRIVHVITGRLKNSLYPVVDFKGDAVEGRVTTNVAYAIYEVQRGGDHDFAGRTVSEEGPHVAAWLGQEVAREVNDVFA